MSPIQKFQTIARTIPRITRIPPMPMPAIPTSFVAPPGDGA
jgi:hypothetical protein